MKSDLHKWRCSSPGFQTASQYHQSHLTHPQMNILQQSLLTTETFPMSLLETYHRPSLAHLDTVPPLGDEHPTPFQVLKLPFSFTISVMI